jgi:RNA polymerase sigma-70 factor (ECF subfamily)
VQGHRRELHVHCYRMLGSFDDCEDLVQETFLRAWRGRNTFAGRSSVRAWLYKIATNACLDALDKRPRVAASGEVTWLQPFPDELLDELVATEDAPDVTAIEKETIELAFLTAIQHLAPLPRAVLILRDVLDCSASETADMLETTVASVNSALQRARRHESAPARAAPRVGAGHGPDRGRARAARPLHCPQRARRRPRPR